MVILLEDIFDRSTVINDYSDFKRKVGEEDIPHIKELLKTRVYKHIHNTYIVKCDNVGWCIIFKRYPENFWTVHYLNYNGSYIGKVTITLAELKLTIKFFAEDFDCLTSNLCLNILVKSPHVNESISVELWCGCGGVMHLKNIVVDPLAEIGIASLYPSFGLLNN